MELKEVNLGPLVITDALDRAQISGNIYQSTFSIFNNGWHCCELTETLASIFILQGDIVF